MFIENKVDIGFDVKEKFRHLLLNNRVAKIIRIQSYDKY